MDKFVVPMSKTEQHKPIKRDRWQRICVETEGRMKPNYRHQMSSLLMQSYSQVASFDHSYLIGGVQCPDHAINRENSGYDSPYSEYGISALEFDKKGMYLAIGTKTGCLTVIDFESLSSQVIFKCPFRLRKDAAMHLLHIPRDHEVDVVRWNLANQDEVACTTTNNKGLLIFDIGNMSSRPVQVLSKRHSPMGCSPRKGFTDIAFTSNSDSRVLASDTFGIVHVWDRRKGKVPCHGFTSSYGIINSIQVTEDNQTILGACKSGGIYVWDIRGGKPDTAFQREREACYSPVASLKLVNELEKVESLKAQSNIVPKKIHSININPSCPYQLAFHLDDGWSGVLDIHNFRVTHVHCPPPPCWEGGDDSKNLPSLRKPSWISTHSMYAVASAHSRGIYLLDFYPNQSSPCHIDYKEDIECDLGKKQQPKNRFVPLFDSVAACAAHPLNDTIVAGTKDSELLVISQKNPPETIEDLLEAVALECQRNPLYESSNI